MLVPFLPWFLLSYLPQTGRYLENSELGTQLALVALALAGRTGLVLADS